MRRDRERMSANGPHGPVIMVNINSGCDRSHLVHTNGVGSAAYNRELSHRRAQSVVAFLAQAADIPIYRIKTSGMGFDYPKYPSDPRNAANRRVQVLLVE